MYDFPLGIINQTQISPASKDGYGTSNDAPCYPPCSEESTCQTMSLTDVSLCMSGFRKNFKRLATIEAKSFVELTETCSLMSPSRGLGECFHVSLQGCGLG